MIRLLLVDDHTIMRESLRAVLEREPDIKVLGEAGEGETALARVLELVPDMVLTDISMPGFDGIELTQRIMKANPGVKVLALSTHRGQYFVEQMLAVGAQGYVNKTAGREELLRAIRTVAAGKRYLCKEVVAMLRKSPAGEGAQVKLGWREIEVLKKLALGETTSATAESLYIPLGIVEVHQRNIMRKLDLHDPAGLTQYAVRNGLISL